MACKKNSGGRPRRGAVLMAAAVILGVAVVGCDDEQKAKIRDAAHAAILTYVEEKGQDKAAAYVDKLVADGELGTASGEKIKAAIPQGVEKLREVMGEEEKKESEVQK